MIFLAVPVVLLVVALVLIEVLRTTPHGKLHPVAALLALGDRMMAKTADPTDPVARREGLSEKTAMIAGTPRQLESVTDSSVVGSTGEIAIRIYDPGPSDGPRRGCLYFHGGGYVVGDLDSSDALAREMAHHLGTLVVSVDYRLAPEHPFPEGLADAREVLGWVREHTEDLGIDRDRIVLSGDSAGGGLAAALALDAVAGGDPIYATVLFYPWVDLADESSESMDIFADGLVLSAEDIRWFRSQYAPDSSTWTDPFVSPARTPDLSVFPPTVNFAAEFDVLRDQVLSFGADLAAAGVKTETHVVRGQLHGFFSMTRVFSRLISRQLRAAGRFLDRLDEPETSRVR